jgi:hypothetical protein
MACLVVNDVKKCSQTETKSMHKFCRSPLSASRELISCGKNERITIFRNERCFETKQRHTKCDAPQAAVTGGTHKKKLVSDLLKIQIRFATLTETGRRSLPRFA